MPLVTVSSLTVEKLVVVEGSEKLLTAEDTIQLVERNLISLFGSTYPFTSTQNRTKPMKNHKSNTNPKRHKIVFDLVWSVFVRHESDLRQRNDIVKYSIP